jgi:hypothetical protein
MMNDVTRFGKRWPSFVNALSGHSPEKTGINRKGHSYSQDGL